MSSQLPPAVPVDSSPPAKMEGCWLRESAYNW